MYGLILWLWSFIKTRKANELSLNPDDVSTLWPEFQSWVVGHNSSLFELLSGVCVLKQERTGGIIVLGGDKQRGTKLAIISKLAEVWSQLVQEPEKAPLRVSERALGKKCIKDILSNLYVKEKRTVWITTSHKNTSILKALVDLNASIRDKNVLCILDVQGTVAGDKKFGPLPVTACVNLEVDKQELEATFREKWVEAGHDVPLTKDDIIHAVVALCVDSSPERFDMAIQYIVDRATQDSEPEENPSKKTKRDGVAVTNESGKQQLHAVGTNASSSHNTTKSPNTKSNNTNSHNVSNLNPTLATGRIDDGQVAYSTIFGERIPEGYKTHHEKAAAAQAAIPAEFDTTPFPKKALVSALKMAENTAPLLKRVVDIAETILPDPKKRKTPDTKDTKESNSQDAKH